MYSVKGFKRSILQVEKFTSKERNHSDVSKDRYLCCQTRKLSYSEKIASRSSIKSQRVFFFIKSQILSAFSEPHHNRQPRQSIFKFFLETYIKFDRNNRNNNRRSCLQETCLWYSSAFFLHQTIPGFDDFFWNYSNDFQNFQKLRGRIDLQLHSIFDGTHNEFSHKETIHKEL